jgi:hypothetical protein
LQRRPYAINSCLENENGTTSDNYKEFATALRSILAFQVPNEQQTPTVPGPTGTPLSSAELAQEFDAAQAAWEKYRELACSAAFDLYKGGTVALSQQLSCNLTLFRSRMRDLSAIYYLRLNN